MNVMHRHRIRDAFAAARDYDRHARVQRLVARRLARRIAALPLPPSPRILEIGCGTGFLTEAMIEHGVSGNWLVTDIAPAMVERCRARIGGSARCSFATLDGEYGEIADGGRFDLICSSLVMQWFEDQERALARLIGWLAPGGHCLFSTLASDSLAEWRQAHAAEELEAGTPRFASLAELEAMHPEARAAPLTAERVVERHEAALPFIRSLKAIGAATAPPAHRPLAAAELRRVMRRFEENGASVTYEVVTGHYVRPPPPR